METTLNIHAGKLTTIELAQSEAKANAGVRVGLQETKLRRGMERSFLEVGGLPVLSTGQPLE